MPIILQASARRFGRVPLRPRRSKRRGRLRAERGPNLRVDTQRFARELSGIAHPAILLPRNAPHHRLN